MATDGARQRSGAVVATKLTPPALGGALVERSRLTTLLSRGERIALVVAPPGYGKTVAVRHWVETAGAPAAWLSLDLLDDAPATFWQHVIRAIRVVTDDVDDEPELVLAERGPHDGHHLAVLTAQLDAAGQPLALVLDDLSRIGDRSVLAGLELLVDRAGHLLRIVVTARSDPALPLARWRAAGWSSEVRESDLRLTADEAVTVARALRMDLGADDVRGLNARLEGWPIGVHLALVSGAPAPGPGDERASHHRLLADYLVAEVLDRLPDDERDAALALSVVDWFDPELVRALLGDEALPTVAALQRRRLFLTVLDPERAALRFHSLFRELLENELRWRDPVRRTTLHRRAADEWRRRGDLNAAHRHLVTVGDDAAARDLVVQPVLELVDRGDRVGLARMLELLPPELEVDDPSLALDLATAWFFAGQGDEAGRWCDRAERLMTADDVRVRLRLHTTRCMHALMRGDVDDAQHHVDGYLELAPSVGTPHPLDARFATTATRVALACGDVAGARRWVTRARTIAGPPMVTSLTVPALDAWLELSTGRLDRARAIVGRIGERALTSPARPHHGVFDALVIAGWCALAAGDVTAASRHAEAAGEDAVALGYPWNTVRAGALRAEVQRLSVGPSTALAVVRDVRASIDHPVAPVLLGVLDRVEALALLSLGRHDELAAATERLGAHPVGRVTRAWAAWRTHGAPTDELEALLGDRDTWALPDRLGAEVVLACADPGPGGDRRLVAALDDGIASGWIWPFLGHETLVAERIRAALGARRVPAIARWGEVATDASTTDPASALVEPLTARERTVLELLPTHYSYAQIGERLHLSVNTVKTNLKSVYRKLGVSSRAEAVDAARRLGLA